MYRVCTHTYTHTHTNTPTYTTHTAFCSLQWLQYVYLSYLMVLSEDPLTTWCPLYCKQAMPLRWPWRVLTNSLVDVLQTYGWVMSTSIVSSEYTVHTLIVLSPDADTMYLSSKSTTFTAARWPTRTRLSTISLGAFMSHTAIVRSWTTNTLVTQHTTSTLLVNKAWSYTCILVCCCSQTHYSSGAIFDLDPPQLLVPTNT